MAQQEVERWLALLLLSAMVFSSAEVVSSVAASSSIITPPPLKTIEQAEADALSKLEKVGGKELFRDLLPVCWGHNDRSSFCGPLTWTSNSDSLAANIGNGELLPNLSPISLTADLVQESRIVGLYGEEEDLQCRTSRNPLPRTPLNKKLAELHGTAASSISTWLDGLEGDHLIDYIQQPGDLSKGGRGREVQSRFLSEPLTSYTLRRSFLRDRKEALLFPHQRISMINPVKRKLPIESTSSSSSNGVGSEPNLGKVLELQFIRFVSPSEHTLSGSPVELELQLHMKYADSGPSDDDDLELEDISYEEEISKVKTEAKQFASTTTFLNSTDVVMVFFFQVGRRESSHLDALLRGRKSLVDRSGHSMCEDLLRPWLSPDDNRAASGSSSGAGVFISTSEGSTRDDVGATITCLKQEITNRYASHASVSEVNTGQNSTNRWMNCFLPTALECEVYRRVKQHDTDLLLSGASSSAGTSARDPTGSISSSSSQRSAGGLSDSESLDSTSADMTNLLSSGILVHELEHMCSSPSSTTTAALESFDEDFETSGPVVLGNLLKEGTTSQTAAYFYRLGSITHGEKASLFASDEKGGKSSVGEVEWILLKEPATIGYEQLRYVREEILGFDALPINNDSHPLAQLQRHRSRVSYEQSSGSFTSSSSTAAVANFNLAYSPSVTGEDNTSFSGLNFVLNSNSRPFLQMTPVEGNQKRIVRATHFSSASALTVAEYGETSTCLLFFDPSVVQSLGGRGTPTLSSPPSFGGISGGDWTVDTAVELWQSVYSRGMKPLTGRDGFDDTADLALCLSLLALVSVAPYLLLRLRKQLRRWQRQLHDAQGEGEHRQSLHSSDDEGEQDGTDSDEDEGGHPSHKYEIRQENEGSTLLADVSMLNTTTGTQRPHPVVEDGEEQHEAEEQEEEKQMDPEWSESLIEQGSIAMSEHGDLEQENSHSFKE